jgi:histidinol-phosphatase
VAETLEADLQLALELADEADRITMQHYQSEQLTIETKPDLSPVTEADRKTEQAIRQILQRQRPDPQVLGEEFGGDARSHATRWIIDPIDGTKRYMRGVPSFGTLLALEKDGELVIGVASAPALGRRWWAARGLGAFVNSTRMRVSKVQALKDAHIALASLDSWIARDQFAQLERIARGAWTSTGYGDFWVHMLVAEGAADAALEPAGEVWDFAALKVIVEEAGGRFTDFGGTSSASRGSALSSNAGPIHAELLALLGSG